MLPRNVFQWGCEKDSILVPTLTTDIPEVEGIITEAVACVTTFWKSSGARE
jgi:hypothetical protein